MSFLSLKSSLRFLVVILFCIIVNSEDQISHYDIKLPLFLKTIWKLNSSFSSKQNTECRRDIVLVLKGIWNQEDWAIRILDATAKYMNGRGTFQGNSLILGSADLCRNITPPSFSTAFCSLIIPVPLQVIDFAKIEVCLPATCKENNINELIEPVKESLENVLSQSLHFRFNCLSSEKKQEFDPIIFSVLLLCCFLGSLVIFATIYGKILMERFRFKQYCSKFLQIQAERILKEEPSNWKGKLLLCFSAKKNLKTLFDLKTSGELRCLDGIRVLSMAMVIFGHTSINLSANSDNASRYLEYSQTNLPIFCILNSLPYSVDSFFAISGLLQTYNYLKSNSKGIKQSWIEFYSKRFIRISPAFYLTIIIFFGVLRRQKSDDSHHMLEGIQKNFVGDMLSNFLFVNNIFKDKYLRYTWYIASDMQYYIMLPILLTQIVKSKRRGILILSLTLLFISFTTFMVAYSNKYSITSYKNTYTYYINIFVDEFYSLYTQPYCRGTYFIGVCFGWLLFERKCQFHIRKIYQYILWIISFLCIYWSLFFLYHFDVDLILSSICYFLLKDLWTVGLCIIIFLCCTNNGGIIQSFLCWPGWLPLSRLSYSIYLIHEIILEIAVSKVLKNLDYSVGLAVFYFLVYLHYIVVGGILLNLMIEAPVVNIKETFFKTGNSNKNH